jgi:hypothetical protein
MTQFWNVLALLQAEALSGIVFWENTCNTINNETRKIRGRYLENIILCYRLRHRKFVLFSILDDLRYLFTEEWYDRQNRHAWSFRGPG